MPSYISNDGVWTPAKEKVALVNNENKPITINGKEIGPGEPYIYEGPDRAAEFELFQTGEKHFGVEFWKDPDMIQRAKNLGYKDIFEYATEMGWERKKSQEDFEKKASVVQKHEAPKKSKAREIEGGGKDFSGSGADVYGGFGKPKEIK
jgi:hypothetical protein